MNEKLLQYLWNYKLFSITIFEDIEGNALEILDYGKINTNSGPDFTQAKIRFKDLIWVGNIEIHSNTSDWNRHLHSDNSEYQNIILHVVYNHDKDNDYFKKHDIPILELKKYVDVKLLEKYQLVNQNFQFIPCEKLINSKHIPLNYFEENLNKKLDHKTQIIEAELIRYKNNYEAVLFHQIAYAFGLKINSDIFKSICQSVEFSVILKIAQNRFQLESLFFGLSNWLENPIDTFTTHCSQEFNFLLHKYGISKTEFHPKFLRLRPSNFPTIRLSQLAHLYHREKSIFSKIINAEKADDLRELFSEISASEYWNTHYTFNKKSNFDTSKKLSSSFIDLLILNAILPIKYAYNKHQNSRSIENTIEIYNEIKPEKNSIIEKWKELNLTCNSALNTQALLYQYSAFCTEKKCLNCSIGYQILKQK